ncbi:MAG: O-antigen ligase family protein [Elusimicrobiota bacterium]
MRPAWSVRLLAAAILLGGLRDPRLAALGEAAVFAALWIERPLFGAAAPWLPWLAWAAASGALSLQPLAALPALARAAAALGFASLAAAWGAREREEWLKTTLAVCVILAAAAFWTGVPLGFRATMTGLIPPYYNYSTFVLAAGAAAAVAWALHPGAVRPAHRLAALAAAGASVAAIGFAHSRGAFIALACAAAAWAARRWGKAAFAAAAVAAALAGGAIWAGRLPASWRGVAVKNDRQVSEARPAIWRRAAEIADEHPWLGEGPGSFGVGFRRRPVEARGARARWGLTTEFAHSEPLQAAAETGWMGLALWLLGLTASLRTLWRRTDEEPAREAAAVAAVAMAVQLLIDNMLQIPGLALLFFSALAVAGERTPGRRRWPGAAVFAGGLLAATAWVPRALADGNPSRAAALFPRESDLKEDLAYKVMTAGRWAEADAVWAQAEDLAPFNAIYPWRRAQIAALRGRWDEARVHAERALEVEPGFLNVRVLRAEALRRLGRPAEARAELAAVADAFASRSSPPGFTYYDSRIWILDSAEYERVAALLRRPTR